jgi:hypothetical protein
LSRVFINYAGIHIAQDTDCELFTPQGYDCNAPDFLYPVGHDENKEGLVSI